MRSRPSRAVLIDLVVVLVLLALGVEETSEAGVTAPGPVDTLLVPLAILPLLLRRRRPLLAAAAWSAGCVLSGIPTFDQGRCGVVIIAGLLILFSLGGRATRPAVLAGLVLMLGGVVFLLWTDASVDDVPGGIALVVPLCVAVCLGGRVVAGRRRTIAALAARTREVAHRREQTALVAVEVERAHLATDLDAAVRSTLRETSALAGAALAAPGLAPGAFERIERDCRAALNDMRSLVGVLRSDERAPATPRPTLAELETLIEEARRGGRWVELAVAGTRRPLPSGVELTAYRALQHALMTVHGAGDDPARIALSYGSGDLALEVSGRAAVGVAAEAAMAAARERIVSHGGSFDADMPLGRRVLRATLPAVPLGA
jgi:signal transduction histidine kinase